MDSVLDDVRTVIGDVLDRGDGSWRALQEAGLLALAAPKHLGGEGLGLAEIAVLLHEVGRRAAELPVWETLACGLLPLVRSGSDELQAELVPRIVAGELLLSPALRGSATIDGVAVTGTKIGVPVLDGTTLLLVSAADVVAIVDPDGPGVSRVETGTSRGAGQVVKLRCRYAPVPIVPVVQNVPAVESDRHEHEARGMVEPFNGSNVQQFNVEWAAANEGPGDVGERIVSL